MADADFWLSGMRSTLREALAEWQDWDVAGFHLGICLGLWENTREAWLANKYRFWSDDAFGNFLVRFLGHLAEQGILEHDADEARFRWRTGPVLIGDASSQN